MPKVIKNLTQKPVYIHLNSRQLVALSPGETSRKIRSVELVNNATIVKLKNRGVIKITAVEGKKEKVAGVKKTDKTGKVKKAGKNMNEKSEKKKEEDKDKSVV